MRKAQASSRNGALGVYILCARKVLEKELQMYSRKTKTDVLLRSIWIVPPTYGEPRSRGQRAQFTHNVATTF